MAEMNVKIIVDSLEKFFVESPEPPLVMVVWRPNQGSGHEATVRIKIAGEECYVAFPTFIPDQNKGGDLTLPHCD